jgi:hypothetical protein
MEGVTDMSGERAVAAIPDDATPLKRLRYRYNQFIYWGSVALDGTYGRSSHSVYVLGYIKSGTNWLCNLLANALDLPGLEPWNMTWPSGRPHVFHVHRFIPIENIRQRTVYIMRDGRDCMVSAYFYIANSRRAPRPALERLFGGEMSYENARKYLPKLIRYMADNRLMAMNHKAHVERSLRYRYVRVQYEDLLRDTSGELARVIRELKGAEPDPAAVRRAVEQNSFHRLANRAPGQEDTSSFFRKGVSGDWRAYFSREAAETFDQYAGQLLIDLGYEKDHEWVRHVS